MKHFLSHGGGVNSVAYQIMMIDEGVEFESVFIDHGADHPSTYAYMEYFNNELIKRGHRPVTVVKGLVQEKSMDKPLNLYDYCFYKQTVPQRMMRWCTEKFKIIPVNLYINQLLEEGEECYYHLGIAYDEAHRANAPKNPAPYMRNKIHQYWFVDRGLTRQDNIDMILKAGFKVPPKSGCYICPFQPNAEFRKLYKEEPCLYQKAKDLEHVANERRSLKGLSKTGIKEKPLEIIVQEGQMFLDENEDGNFEWILERKPCNCGL